MKQQPGGLGEIADQRQREAFSSKEDAGEPGDCESVVTPDLEDMVFFTRHCSLEQRRSAFRLNRVGGLSRCRRLKGRGQRRRGTRSPSWKESVKEGRGVRKWNDWVQDWTSWCG